ncbi:MAG: TraC family protein [Gammaproteobacteria bacterium]|nr:TraC family protein [Gammaproteobacteria bacterium]
MRNFNETLTKTQLEKCYQLSASLLYHLSWVEFNDQNNVILLQDKTVCAALEVSLLSSETKPLLALESLRNNLQGLFQDTFTLYRDNESPWIMQCYLEDHLSMQSLYQKIQKSIQPLAQRQPLTEKYLMQMQHYCD